MAESIARGSVLSLLGSSVTLVAGLGTNVVIARVLGPEMKGLLTIFLTTQGLLALPGFAVQAGVINFIARRRPSWPQLRRFLDCIALAQAVVSVGTLAVVIQVPVVKTILLGALDTKYLWAMLASLVPIIVFMYRSSLLSGLGMPGRGALWSTAGSLVQSGTLLVPLVWWWWTGAAPDTGTVIIATAVATALGSSVWIVPTTWITLPAADPVRLRVAALTIGAFAAPVLARTLVEWVNRRIDVYFVQALAGARELGLYTVAVGLGQQSWFIPLAVTGPIFARVSAAGDTARSRELTQYAFRVSAQVSLVLGLVTGVLAPVLLPLAYGERFRGAIILLLLLLPGVVAIGPTPALSSYLSAIGRPHEPLRAEIAAGCLTLVLLAVLVSRMGAAGAAVASSVAYIAYAGLLCARFVHLSGSRWSDVVAFRRGDWVDIIARLSGNRLVLGRSHAG